MKEKKVLGLRYYGSEMKDYYNVVTIAKQNKLSMSKAGKLLINRGLTHTNNPRPLIDTPKNDVSKIHQKDTPKEDIKVEHLTDTPKDDALKVHKVNAQKETPKDVTPTPNESGWGWYLIGGLLIAGGWKLAKDFGWL